jgi:hypothetical protein
MTPQRKAVSTMLVGDFGSAMAMPRFDFSTSIVATQMRVSGVFRTTLT